MNYPRRLIIEKDYAYLWKLFNDFRTITERFIRAEGYFSFWHRVISTILPLFCLPLKPSSPPPPTEFLRAGIFALSLLEKDQTFFSLHPTTFSQVLKRFYIRPPLSFSIYPSFHLFTPSMDIFILRMLDVWATVCWKRYFHCPPVVEMDFE